MSEVTVEQFAEVLKVTVDKLLSQLEEAGIKSLGPKDRISDDAKHELLTHLRKAHGKGEDGGAPRKITLRRKAQSEIKVAAPMGKARTVSVEVRRQRTYIKRDVLEEQARVAQEALDQQREVEDAERVGRRAVAQARGRAARTAATRTRGERAPHGRGGHEAPGRGAGTPRCRAEGARTGGKGAAPARGKGPQDDRRRQEHALRAPGTAHRRWTISAPQERPHAPRIETARGDRQHGPQARFRASDPAHAARGGSRGDHHRRGTRPEDGREVERSHEDDAQHGRHRHDQPAGGPGHRGARDRGNGSRREGAQGRPGGRGPPGRHARLGRGAAASARRHHHGTRRPRQDVTARLHPPHESRRR